MFQLRIYQNLSSSMQMIDIFIGKSIYFQAGSDRKFCMWLGYYGSYSDYI